MTQILAVTFPIYGAIAIGYFIVLRGWFSAGDMRVMGKYVLNIALPALLFNAVATRDISEVFHPTYILVFLGGGLAVIALAYGWFSLTGADKARRAVAVMGCSCPNSGFIGYPVMLLVFPDIAGLILALNMLVENFVLVPICLVMMEMAKPGGTQTGFGKVAIALLDVFKRPIVLALAAGLLVSLLGLPIPGMADRLVNMLAMSASALSLIVVGGSMVGLTRKGNQFQALQIAIGKLICHPVLVFGGALALPLLGFATLPPDMFGAIAISAAMPMFGVFTVFSQELGLEGLASIAMLTATSLAFISLSLLLFWLV